MEVACQPSSIDRVDTLLRVNVFHLFRVHARCLTCDTELVKASEGFEDCLLCKIRPSDAKEGGVPDFQHISTAVSQACMYPRKDLLQAVELIIINIVDRWIDELRVRYRVIGQYG